MSLRVLLVDDEEHLRRIARVSLERVGGCAVQTADGGESALAVLAEHSFDVVLLDVMMPGMDGLSTLARIRERPGLASLPVIFVTAKITPPEVARYLAAGAVGVVEKPFDPMRLSAQVQALVAAAASASAGVKPHS